GHRRPVRGDQGPHRRLDGHRRRVRGTRVRGRGLPLLRPRARGQAPAGVDRGAPVPHGGPERHRVSAEPAQPSEDLCARLKELGPRVLAALVRRGADFPSAEDAVQEALIEALGHWRDGIPRDPRAWLVTVARRKYVDAQRSEVARRRRELREAEEPPPGPTEQADGTLLLLFLCCHPALPPASAVALTLRAVAGLTTRQIAEAFLVPEATMAQRISRAKRSLRGERLTRPGDL